MMLTSEAPGHLSETSLSRLFGSRLALICSSVVKNKECLLVSIEIINAKMQHLRYSFSEGAKNAEVLITGVE